MKFTLSNDTQAIPALAEQVENYLAGQGVGPQAVMQINLCLDELLVNTISYGYTDDAPHAIEVDIRLVDGRMEVEIVDDAAAFDPIGDAPPPDLDSDLEQRPIGGLGIHFVKQLTDSVSYRRDADGYNRLLLVKRL